jgi:hypothetical protein
VALVDGVHVGQTAAMLGGWDPISTLLRRAVQQDAGRLVSTATPILASDPAMLASADRRIIAESRRGGPDWISRAVFAPSEELALPLLLSRGVEVRTVCLVAMGAAVAGGLCSLLGWRWAALILLMLSGPLAAWTVRLARIRDRAGRLLETLTPIRLLGGTLGAAGLGAQLHAASGQWGWLLIAALVPATLLARLPAGRPMNWLASMDALLWVMFPFAAMGQWGWGLATVALYALGSFGFVQWQAHHDRRVA